MSSRNRERKAANREKREAHEAAMRRRAIRRRWIIAGGGLVLAAVIAFVVVSNLGDDDDNQIAADDSATTTAPAPETTAPVTLPPLASVAGQPCVEVSEELPAGAPAVPVKVGPPPTELVVEDLVVGDGAEVVEGASVTVNYIGVACSTGVIFDSSYKTGTPQPITQTLDRFIAGWQQGLVGMKVGGQRLLGIPPSLAYGSEQNGDKIAPDETLWFVVDLVETAPAQ